MDQLITYGPVVSGFTFYDDFYDFKIMLIAEI